MGKIHILDDHVANQIAAGEVVERPASVVKELVENAIDAGSTVIETNIEDGGLKSIHVIDNGSGMSREDCLLAFHRHATSKIAAGRDLFRIRTLGFRGEALPSIAAVSKMELISSADESGLAHRLIIEGGEVKSVEAATGRRGTQIKVSDLFYNTPARLKYMKTIQTELAHISDFMQRLSFARPDISFELRHNGKRLFRSPGNGDLLQTIAAIYGALTAKQMIPIEAADPDYAMKGYVSRPELTRAGRTGISFIINQRYVRHYSLHKALMEAYHTLLPLNRYPIAVIDLQMDPALVDVNVHPAKLDVRFSKEKELLAFVQQHVRKALQQEVLIPSTRPAAPKPAVVQEQLRFQAEQAEKPLPKPNRAGSKDGDWRTTSEFQTTSEIAENSHAYASSVKEGRPATYANRPRFKQPLQKPTEEAYRELYRKDEHMTGGQAPAARFPTLYPIGQMRGTYIIAQNEDGLYLIDQHAAHERIHYEYFYEKFGKTIDASQELLVPITIELTSAEALMIEGKLSWLEQSGVYMEHFGGTTYRVTACPHWFPKGEEEEIIRDMIEWIIQEKGAIDIAKLREKASILCSCKASIKANQALTLEEIEALLERLSRCRNPYTCPHGRPIVVSFSNYELEKLFKRA